MNLTLAIILLVLSVAGVVVRKTYFFTPLHELKRRAKKHDKFAAKIYPAVAYGNSLRALLWLYIGLTTAASIIILARILPFWVSLLIVGPILWAAFSWIPASRITKIGSKLTTVITPSVLFLLNLLHPVLSRISDVIHKFTTYQEHTGLFEKEDLIKLIELQSWQKDSRFTTEELEIAKRALSFDQYIVGDILISRKNIKTVYATDTIGPVLIDELHKNGQDYVLVKDKKGGEVVGTLEFKRLGLGSSGKVQEHMNVNVYYIHEADGLGQALHAFFETNHNVFIVVNSFEEYVGIISIENILEQLLGHVPGEDFSQYEDISAVVSRHTKNIESPQDDKTPVKTDDKVVE